MWSTDRDGRVEGDDETANILNSPKADELSTLGRVRSIME